jgi:hypothetical protein
MNNKSSPIIVTFIGPVGVGKSTQIRMLKNYFIINNEKTIESYIKSVHGLTYVLNILIEKIANMVTNKGIFRKESLKKRLYIHITPVWIITETISIVCKFFFLVYIPFRLGYNVLLEEGLFMSIENYLIFRPFFLGVKPVEIPYLELLLRWINNHNHLDIVLEADDEKIDKRRKSRTFRRSETEDYVKLQRISMSRLKGSNILRIETSHKTINEVHDTIIQYLLDKHYSC